MTDDPRTPRGQQCARCGVTHPGCTAHTTRGKPCGRAPALGLTVCNLMDEIAPRHTSWKVRTGVGKEALTCDNRNGRRGAGNTADGLTRSSGTSREGLAMKATRKRGIDPAPTAPQGLTSELKAIYDAWPARFRSKVRLSASCWDWTACKDANGYGRYGTTRARGTQAAHRMALELTHGTTPDEGMHVDHLCRNTSCVRPDHLEVVTHAENIRRGAAANTSGWCRAGLHEWTPENILTEPDGTRRCRPCRDERERAYRPPNGNANGSKTHCPRGHAYDEVNTYVSKKGHRLCKTCSNELRRARRAARKAGV